MTDDIATLRRVRRDCRTMAVAGLSADWHRPSYFAARYLQQRRYRIISVNPRYAELLGERCHPSLADIPHRVDRVDVFRRTEAVLPIAEQAITIGAHCLWQQTGVTNLAAAEQVRSAARVRSAGLDSVLDRVAALEGGRAAFAFACACASASASGMAAEATALLSLPEAGDHMVAAGTQYCGSVSLPAVNLKKLGTSTTFVDAASPDAFAAAMRPNTRAVFAESLGNPSLHVLDIEAVADVAHAHGVPLIVDNTVASPFLCTPLRFGADIVVHSATKYLAGHGTTLGGVIVEAGKSNPGFAWDSGKFPGFAWDNGKFPGMTEPSPGYHGVKFLETFGDLAFTMRARMETLRVYGAALAPMSAWQILQGVETLPLRMERHCTNARKVALFLRAHPQVAWVNYPGLADHEQRAIVAKQFRLVDGAPGASGLLAFGVKPAVAGASAGAADALSAAIRFIDAAQFMSHVANIGDTRTLIIHPASTTHRQLTDAQRIAAGAGPDVVRLSIGIEDAADIIGDLDQALAH